MPDILDASGLTVKTVDEITSDLAIGLQSIYGADINIDQNSPDGQMIGIFAQAATDLRELLLSIYNSFNPNHAVGTVLDQRVPINNIARQAGTYTIQPVSITVDRTVTLQGLDDDFSNPDGMGYTVQDDAGNKFILQDTTILTAGTTSLNFRAQKMGKVETTVGTIINPVTIVLGVTAINNPSAALQVGQDEETDLQLRLRRERSVAIGSSGYLDGLRGDLLNISGVTDAKVYENDSDSVVNTIPAHGIWAVVEGGSNTDIAAAIYARKTPGTNMKGSVSVDVTTASGQTFTALFDRPVANNLYIRFDAQRTLSGSSVDTAAVKAYIAANLDYNINDYAETSLITQVARDALTATGAKAVPINMEISADGSTWVDYLTPATLAGQFVVDTSRITITVI